MSGSLEPVYPLTREEFRRALASGHGRAWIHVQRFGAAEFRDEILEAATFCQVCDPQVNGPRGEWLAQLCVAAGVAEIVVAQPFPENHRDRNQRVALLLEFARRGIAGARRALYDCLHRAQGTSDVYASREIIELDGEAGLLFVVRAMGVLLATEADFSVWGYELSVFDEQHSEGAGRAILEREAATDASIRLYLERVESYRARLETSRGQQASPRADSPSESPPRAPIQADEGLVLRELQSLRGSETDRLHEAGANALELLEDCPELSGAAIALEVYAWNPCAHCRGLAFEHLLERKACPQWVIDECAHDGAEWIRDLAVRGLPPARDTR